MVSATELGKGTAIPGSGGASTDDTAADVTADPAAAALTPYAPLTVVAVGSNEAGSFVGSMRCVVPSLDAVRGPVPSPDGPLPSEASSDVPIFLICFCDTFRMF